MSQHTAGTEGASQSTDQGGSLLPGDSVQVNGHWFGVVDSDGWMVTLKDDRGELYRVERSQVEGVA